MDHALLRAQIRTIVEDTTIPDNKVFDHIREAHAHLLADDLRSTATTIANKARTTVHDIIARTHTHGDNNDGAA